MRAMMCDRCGKFFSKVNPHSEIKHRTDFLDPNVMTIKDDPIYYTYDLCEECSNEFEKWMKPYGNEK